MKPALTSLQMFEAMTGQTLTAREICERCQAMFPEAETKLRRITQKIKILQDSPTVRIRVTKKGGLNAYTLEHFSDAFRNRSGKLSETKKMISDGKRRSKVYLSPEGRTERFVTGYMRDFDRLIKGGKT